MSNFDVRQAGAGEITTVIFEEPMVGNTVVSSHLTKRHNGAGINICDREYDLETNEGFVVVRYAESARNLIKALEKAIELGWLVEEQRK